MKKEVQLFQIKEQGKSPETNPNEMEICDLPLQKMKNNDHKDIHGTQDNNVWAK